MNCQECQTKLFLLGDPEISAEEEQSIKDHCQHCARCSEELAIYESIVRNYQALEPEELSAEVRRSILEQAEQQSLIARALSLWKSYHTVLIPAFSAALILLFFNLFSFFGPDRIVLDQAGSELFQKTSLANGIDRPSLIVPWNDLSIHSLTRDRQVIDRLAHRISLMHNETFTFALETDPQVKQLSVRIQSLNKDTFFRR